MATLLHFGLSFPERRWPLRHAPRLTVAVIYGAAIVFTLGFILSHLLQPYTPFVIDYFEFGALGGAVVVLMFNIISSAIASADARRRQQAWVVLPGLAAMAMGVAVLIADSFHLLAIPIPMVIYPAPPLIAAILLAYATVKQNIFEFDAILRRSLTFVTLAVAAVLVYAGAVLTADAVFGSATAWAASILPAIVPLLLLPAAPSLRQKIEAGVEQLLFPGQRLARAAVRDASRELIRYRDSEELVRSLRQLAAGFFAASTLRVVVGEPGKDLNELAPMPGSAASVITPKDPLYEDLGRGHSRAIMAGEVSPSRHSAHQRASRMGIAVAVAFPPTERSIGGLLLGPRSDDRLYTGDDQVLLETLAGHVAVALDNARAWDAIRSLESRLTAETVYLRQELAAGHGFGDIIGSSSSLTSVLARVQQVAPTDAGVLVIGETGSGKELIVRAIHAQSRRADQPLIKVACAALPEALLESELFGHERGAFTGALTRKLGRFEVADGGTMFFDDVDVLPMGVQAKLLRALQEGEIQRLGDNEVKRVDVRVIAATNRDLLEEVRAGRFREDLYYRLNVVPIHLPPLRQRLDDIPALVEHFVRTEGAKLGRNIRAVSAETLTALRAYSWPGNIRELRNVIERALVFASDDVLRLPGPLLSSSPRIDAAPMAEVGSAPLVDLLRIYKTQIIKRALEASRGNQRMAAELLGLHRPSLTRMIKELGLHSDKIERDD